MTNAELIASALRLIGVVAEGIPLTDEQAVDGMESMNQMLYEWDADGIDVGFIPQTAVEDESPLYADAQFAVRYNLALILAPEYGVEPRSTVIAFARDGYNRLLREAMVAKMTEADMSHLAPSTYEYDIDTDT
jgi:hypothetical protein